MSLTNEQLAFLEQQRRDLDEVPFTAGVEKRKRMWLSIVDNLQTGVEDNMKFEPKNRRLLIRRVGRDASRKQKRDDGILLPEDVKFEKKGNELYSVIAKADDVKLDVKEKDYIVVEDNMVETMTFSREEEEDIVFTTIQENYVKGVVSSWKEKEEETT